jgi:polysaccharide export outer membrane protein
VVPNEKINIFDALGMAGDFTIYGKKENVLLIRDTLNDKKLIRLNLNNKDIVSSPYFYIQSNDIFTWNLISIRSQQQTPTATAILPLRQPVLVSKRFGVST